MNQPPQIVAATAVDFGHQSSCPLCPVFAAARGRIWHPSAPRRAARARARSAQEIGHVVHQALIDQLIDDRRPEPVDVHGIRDAKCSMRRRSCAGQALFSHRHTTSSSAAPAGLPHDGHADGICQGSPRPGVRHDDLDDLRDDVAALFNQDAIADAEDPCGRPRRRCAALRSQSWNPPAARLENGDGRDRAGPAHVDRDVSERGRLLLGRKLVGDRPARKLRGGAEPVPEGEGVDFDDDAIGVERPRLRRASAHSAQKATTASTPSHRLQ